MVAAAVVGVATGLLVAAFDAVTSRLALDNLFDAPLAVQALVPACGLAVAAFCLRFIAAGADSTTSDAYIENYHERSRPLPQRPVVGRVLASIATLGSGGALGFEGPSIYMGTAVGSAIEERFKKYFRSQDVKALLVAGAAGGVAAIFKAPATGMLYALEVPFQEDIARHGILSSLVAAAASYLTFATIMGTAPILSLSTAGSGFSGVDLIGAAVVGVFAGIGARGFAWVIRRAKDVSHRLGVIQRVILLGAGSGLLVVLSHHLFSRSLSLGPGYAVFIWIHSPGQGVWLVVALLAVRLAATAFTVAGGGAGGMFFPLVVEGAILGRLVAGVLVDAGITSGSDPATTMSLFTVLGVAAFLGAGYRTPLAGVMFVAESTGKAVFVVPALIAAAISQLFMADKSVSPFQRSLRRGFLEGRFELPISSVLMADVLTLPSDATIAEFVSQHVVQNRQRAAVVLDEGNYEGLCLLDDAAQVPREEWDSTLVSEILRSDVPVARLTWKLRDALTALEGRGIDRLAVVGDDGTFIGEVRREEIFKLEELLGDAGR